MPEKRRIYLDHGASTPVHPQVIEAMLPYWTEFYGNPSSAHSYGQSAENALEDARARIAGLMNAHPEEIIFTGCGSESDNLALRGVMWKARTRSTQADGRPYHLIISAIEHSAVQETAEQLRDHFGFELTILPVDRWGQIDLAELSAAVRPNTALISVIAASNEIGTMQPIMEIGQLAQSNGIIFHTDAIQAAAVMRWDMAKMPIDLVSIAPHKFYGPKGVGMLYVRRGTNLLSTLTGGSQEDGRRAGTVNVPFAVGAAEAFHLAMAQLADRTAHYLSLRDPLIKGLLEALPEDTVLTGHPSHRLPHHASFAFRGLNGNDLLMHLDMAGIAASSGSACKVGDPKPSATLQALGLEADWTKGGLRLTVGTQNTMQDIGYLLDTIPTVVHKLRRLER